MHLRGQLYPINIITESQVISMSTQSGVSLFPLIRDMQGATCYPSLAFSIETSIVDLYFQLQ